MTPTHATGQLLTSGDLARLLGANVATVRHILNSRPHIHPRQRAGLIRLYGTEAIELVRAEVELIENRKEKVPA